MKVLFLFLLSVIMPCGVSAQNTKGKDDDGKYVKDSVALDEVVVRTSRVKNKDNALRLFPTKEQKANSTMPMACSRGLRCLTFRSTK